MVKWRLQIEGDDKCDCGEPQTVEHLLISYMYQEPSNMLHG